MQLSYGRSARGSAARSGARPGARRAGRALRALAVVPLLALGLGGCASFSVVDTVADAPETPLSADATAALDGVLARAVELSGSTGGLAAAWIPGVGTWRGAAGAANAEGTIPVSPDMHFRLGTGGTRAVTCDVVAGLAGKGVVDLDVGVETYLPTTAGVSGRTLRQLCDGTSGIAGFVSTLMPSIVDNPTRSWPALEQLSNAQAHSQGAAPGVYAADASTGTLLASLVARAVDGTDWSSTLSGWFSRYGMNDTRTPGAKDTAVPDPSLHGFAYPIAGGAPRCDARRDVTVSSPSALGPTGGVVTTIDDMRILVSALANDPSSDEVWATVGMGGDHQEWQKTGLGVSQMGPMHGFAGIAPGYATAAYTDPVSGITVAIVLNNSSAGSDLVNETALALSSHAVATAGAAGVADAPELPWTPDAVTGAMEGRGVCR